MKGLFRAWVLPASLLLAGLVASCSSGSRDGAPVEGPSEGGGRTTIRITGAGGQTGMEGGCGTGGKLTLDFSAEDVRALVAGPHQTTLGYRPSLSPFQTVDGGTTRSVTVSVRFLDEPETVIACGGARLRQNVELTLAFGQPALDVIFEASLSAFTADRATVSLELEPSVVEAMQLGIERPAGVSMFSIGFTPRGPRGTMVLPRTCGVGAVVLPSDAHCEEPTQPEIDLDRPVNGVSPDDALQTAVHGLSTFGALPVQWNDGTRTTLSIAFEDKPSSVCVNWDALIGISQAAYPEAPTRVHVTTGDGRVDLSLPGRFVWLLNPDRVEQGRYESPGWDGSWSLNAETVLSSATLRDAGALPGVTLPDDGRIGVALMMGVGPGKLKVAQLDIQAWGPTCTGDPQPIASARADSSP